MRTTTLIATKILLVFILFTSLFSIIQAQENQNNHWFFGENAGLDFSNGNPTNISGSLNTFEGCASISDVQGNLLFYTDGITVYDTNGNLMPNGTGLLGDPSATSSAIIVPKPCTPSEYYIFTMDFVNGTDGLNYSLVNMSLNNGLGDIVSTQKNITLLGPNSEKICAVKKSNGLDFWVISCKKDDNEFYVYEVTSAGINPVYTLSIGPNVRAHGYLKASPCGNKLALANFQSNGSSFGDIHLYDFDDVNGIISNPVEIDESLDRCYGIEFSPNCSFLYFSTIGSFTSLVTDGKIYQMDLLNADFPFVEIGTIPDENEINANSYACGALQLSPETNPRILIAKDGEYQLAAIENPNLAFPACVFVQDAVILDQACLLGLPTFISGEISSECGTCNPNDAEDDCGVCDDNPNNDNESCIDCAGIINGNTAIDECGVCGGTGIPVGDCDCEGNSIPIGDCDCEGNSIPVGGCDCEGNSIPIGDCDCEGNVLDACGTCGGNATSIEQCDCNTTILSLNITNVFTPNSDGINDCIVINSNKQIDFSTFKVFNRWGKKVFEKNAFTVLGSMKLWDGNFENKDLSVGVYVFYGLYECGDENNQIFKGNITVLK